MPQQKKTCFWVSAAGNDNPDYSELCTQTNSQSKDSELILFFVGSGGGGDRDGGPHSSKKSRRNL